MTVLDDEIRRMKIDNLKKWAHKKMYSDDSMDDLLSDMIDLICYLYEVKK